MCNDVDQNEQYVHKAQSVSKTKSLKIVPPSDLPTG